MTTQETFPAFQSVRELPASLDASPVNSYGARVVASVLRCPRTGRILYRCKDAAWHDAFKSWQRSGAGSPEPMPSGHLMFEKPAHYGYVPADWDGERLRLATRRAIRSRVVNMLSGGWDRELRQSREGMRTLAKIVRSTVAADLQGTETGAAPFRACILASIS